MGTRCVYLRGRGHKFRNFEIGHDPSSEKPGEPLRKMVVIIGPTGKGKTEIPDALEILHTGKYDQTPGRKTPATKNVDLLDLVGRDMDTLEYRGAFADPMVVIDRTIGWERNKEDDLTGNTFHHVSTSLGGEPKTTAQQKKINKKLGIGPTHYSVRDLLRGSDTDRKNKFLAVMESVETSLTLETCRERIGDLPGDIGSDEETPVAWVHDVRKGVHELSKKRAGRLKELTAERRSVTDAVAETGDLGSLEETDKRITEISEGRDSMISKIGELDALSDNKKSIERSISDALAKVETAEKADSDLPGLREQEERLAADHAAAKENHAESESIAEEARGMLVSCDESIAAVAEQVAGAKVAAKSAKSRLDGAAEGVCPFLQEDCERLKGDGLTALEFALSNAERDRDSLETKLQNIRSEREGIKADAVTADTAEKQAKTVRGTSAQKLADAHNAVIKAESDAAKMEDARTEVDRLQRQLDDIADLASRDDLIKRRDAYSDQLQIARDLRDKIKKARQNEERLAEVKVEIADLGEEIEALQATLQKIDAVRIEAVKELVKPMAERMQRFLGDLGEFHIAMEDSKGNAVFRPGLVSGDSFRRLEQLSDGESRIVLEALRRAANSFQPKPGYCPLVINSFETIDEDLQQTVLAAIMEDIENDSLCQCWLTWNAKRERLPEMLIEAENTGLATIIDLWPDQDEQSADQPRLPALPVPES